MPNPSSAAEQMLRLLDCRYREILDATDRVQGIVTAAWEVFQPALKQRFVQVAQDVKGIQIEFPSLLANLEGKYRAACRGQLFGTKSKWPKRGASIDSPSADDLVDFAYEEDLTLEGEPRS